MLELDFCIDGIWASDNGIYLCKPVTFSQAVPNVQSITVPGRSGDLHIADGSYKNRTAVAECFVLDQTNVTTKMMYVMQYLFYSTGYRELKVSQDTNYIWYARISNAGELEPRMNVLNHFNIEFDCKPFKYVVNSDQYVANTTFKNPTGFDAYPKLKVTTANNGATISLNNRTITFTSSASNVFIDCEDGLAYTSGGQSANNLITCTDFPKWGAGPDTTTIQTINTSGCTIEVAPMWRTL